MDTLDLLSFGTEVGYVVDFVFKENAGDFVAYEAWWVVLVVCREEVVVFEGALLDGELESGSAGHGRVSDNFAPELDGVVGEGIFGATFLVFAVRTFEEAFGPAVAVKPVKSSRDREVLIVLAWIGKVPDHGVDDFFVLAEPDVASPKLAVEVGNHRSSVDVIAVVEVVVVVCGIAKVLVEVAGGVACRGEETFPFGYSRVNFSRSRREYDNLLS